MNIYDQARELGQAMLECEAAVRLNEAREAFDNNKEAQELVEEYADEEEVPRGMYLCGIELVLTIYSRNDFKLEGVVSNDNAEQFWFELDKQFRNADEFIQLIPDYGKLTI